MVVIVTKTSFGPQRHDGQANLVRTLHHSLVVGDWKQALVPAGNKQRVIVLQSCEDAEEEPHARSVY